MIRDGSTYAVDVTRIASLKNAVVFRFKAIYDAMADLLMRKPLNEIPIS